MSFTIFGKEVPLYGLFFFIGIGVAAVVGIFLIKKRKISGFDFTCAAIFTMIGAIVGAKLLFWIVSLGDIIEGFKNGTLEFADIMKGGFVFYGGLIGGAIGLWVYGKCYKTDMRDYFDIFATILPLGHAFGRVGCYFAGCCYGMKTDSFLGMPSWVGFVDESGNIVGYGWSPEGQYRLPVQLMEAAVLLILFAVLMWLFFKKDKRGLNAGIYALTYATWRFIIEFFRGDEARGVALLSTSQWISLAIIGIVVGLYLYNRYGKKKKPIVAVTSENGEAVDGTEENEENAVIPPVVEKAETADTVETVEATETVDEPKNENE